MQVQVAAKNVELGRDQEVCDEDGCLFAGALAGGQLLVVSRTELLTGEDLIEVQSWTMGVVLIITVGVVLLSCACAVFDPHQPSGNVHVTREPTIAKQWSCMSPRAMQEKGRGFSHGILEISWDSCWCLTRGVLCGKLVQFLRHIAIMSENQTNVSCNSRVGGSVGWNTSGDDCLHQSKVAEL